MALDALSFKAKIEAVEDGAEAYAFHVQSIETEKQKGIEESRKNNTENQKLRKYKMALEKLGFEGDEAALDTYVDQMSELKNKATAAEQTKLSLDEVNTKLHELQTNFTKSQTDLAAERQRATELKIGSDKKAIKAKLVENLTGKVYGHDFVADGLINSNQVVLGDNDQIFWKDGENQIPLEDGLKKFIETRADIVINATRPGANSTPTSVNPGAKFSPEQLESMSQADIKANLADVKASLGITTK